MALAIIDCVKQQHAKSGVVVLTGHDEGVIAYSPSINETLALLIDLNQRFNK
jgi:hypothetical protein